MTTRATLYQPQDTDLCTVGDVKDWLGLDQSNNAADNLLQRLVSNASTATLQWLSRQLFLGTVTERRTGGGNSILVLRETPVVQVLSLSINGITIQASTAPGMPGYAFDSDAVYLIGSGGVSGQTGPGLYFSGTTAVFPKAPPLGILVKYQGGYDDIPGDISEAVIQWIGLRFKERTRIGESSKSMAGETTSYALRDMPDHVKRMLTPYRRVATL